MPSINYYQTKIAYELIGQGKPLVFLHGFGEDRRMWKNFVTHFSDYQVLLIDFPGCGQSEARPASIARLAKIVNAVLQAENIEKCVLIGHSMGGYVTLAYAKLYPEKLAGYCLFHSQPNADSAEKKEGRNKAIDFVKKYGSGVYFKGLIPKLFSEAALAKHQHIIQELIENASEMSDEATIFQVQAMRDRPDNQAVLKNTNVPVCFIIGKEDIAVPKENSLNQTYLPSLAAIHILPAVGHMGMFEARTETTTILQEFLTLASF